jgi:hypothetical protein
VRAGKRLIIGAIQGWDDLRKLGRAGLLIESLEPLPCSGRRGGPICTVTGGCGPQSPIRVPSAYRRHDNLGRVMWPPGRINVLYQRYNLMSSGP